MHQLLSGSVLAMVLCLSACSSGGGDDGPDFSIRTTTVSVAGATPVAISGKNLAFLADEATSGTGGTDMNVDGDMVDAIAVAVDTATGVQSVLGVASNLNIPRPLTWMGDELFFIADEALDDRDWNADADTNDLVLLHWTAGSGTTVADFDSVDRVSAAGTTRMVVQGTNLFYTSARTPSGAGDSSLEVVAAATPTVHTSIATQDTHANGLRPTILGKDEGLLFLLLDETVEGRDLNADTDATDTAVLALLDTTLSTTLIRSTGLATPGATAPFRGKRTSSSSHDWDVGFLVSETAQAATNLNAPGNFGGTWQPTQCITFQDADTTDDVLYFLEFAAWDANPGTSPPVNTGLVGCRRIAVANGFVATITPELNAADTAAEGTCDLNQDGDLDDYVVRWVAIDTPVLPLTHPDNIHALADSPGGTRGLAELDNHFVIEVSELEDDLDINGDALRTFELLGWLLPTGSGGADTPWDFTHGSLNSTFVGSSWMREQPDRSRLNVALEEKVMGLNINYTGSQNNPPPPPPPGEDADILDSVPTFGDFGSSSQLTFPGVAIAVDTDDAGIVVARSFCFYRVSEASDSRNWNESGGTGSGDETDMILFRTALGNGTSASMGTLNSIPGRPAIEINLDESSGCAAYIADEQMQGSGTDLNGDSDTNDLVIRYFRF